MDLSPVQFDEFFRKCEANPCATALTQRWADGEQMTAHEQSMAQTYGDLIDLEYERDVLSTYEETEGEAVPE